MVHKKQSHNRCNWSDTLLSILLRELYKQPPCSHPCFALILVEWVRHIRLLTYPSPSRTTGRAWELCVSRFGLVVRHQAGKQKDLGSNLLWLSFLFKGCGLWTLSCDFVPHNYETSKWLSSLPTLMHKSFLW